MGSRETAQCVLLDDFPEGECAGKLFARAGHLNVVILCVGVFA